MSVDGLFGDVDSTYLTLVWYGPVPFYIPTKVLQTFGNLITKDKQTSERSVYGVAKGETNVTLVGYLKGTGKRFFKEILVQIRNLQLWISDQRKKAIKGSFTPGLLEQLFFGTINFPFISPMATEFNMAIKSLAFTHSAEQRDTYAFILNLEKVRPKDYNLKATTIFATATTVATLSLIAAEGMGSFMHSQRMLVDPVEAQIPNDGSIFVVDVNWNQVTTEQLAEILEQFDGGIQIEEGTSEELIDNFVVVPASNIESNVWYHLPIKQDTPTQSFYFRFRNPLGNNPSYIYKISLKAVGNQNAEAVNSNPITGEPENFCVRCSLFRRDPATEGAEVVALTGTEFAFDYVYSSEVYEGMQFSTDEIVCIFSKLDVGYTQHKLGEQRLASLRVEMIVRQKTEEEIASQTIAG